MVSTHVEELRSLNQFPDLWLLQMFNLVEVRCRKIGAEGAVVACDNYAATASRGILIVAVLGADASFFGDRLKGFTVFVAADTAYVNS